MSYPSSVVEPHILLIIQGIKYQKLKSFFTIIGNQFSSLAVHSHQCKSILLFSSLSISMFLQRNSFLFWRKSLSKYWYCLPRYLFSASISSLVLWFPTVKFFLIAFHWNFPHKVSNGLHMFNSNGLSVNNTKYFSCLLSSSNTRFIGTNLFQIYSFLLKIDFFPTQINSRLPFIVSYLICFQALFFSKILNYLGGSLLKSPLVNFCLPFFQIYPCPSFDLNF